MDESRVVVGRRRGPGWRRVAYGVHRSVEPGRPGEGARHPTGPSRGSRVAAADADTEWARRRAERLADLRAWQQLLPASGCFTHLTAAEVQGLWLPPLPDQTPVFASLPAGQDRPRRPGLRVSRLSVTTTPEVVAGVRLAPVPELLLACARDLGVLDLVILVDSALRSGGTSPGEIRAAAGPGRRGAPALREALRYADARAESPWESVLRMFHVFCEVPVEPQVEVYDDQGIFVARGDLHLLGTRTLHEYDGAVHRERRTHVRDLERERGLANTGWVRRGYTSADLLGRAHVMLREADAALGRRHDPGRLEPWRGALRQSLFSPSGRARLRKRWS